MRGGGGNIKKKNIPPIFGKVNEGDHIKKTVDTFLEKLMRATKYFFVLAILIKVNEGDEKKNKQKKHSWKKVFYFLK